MALSAMRGPRTMSRLSGKIALVTGASRGIGRAAARALAADGAHVIIHYGNKAAEADSLANEIRGLGGKADVVGADLAAPDAALSLAKQVKDITNTLDILVLNAGTGIAAPIEKTTVADFDRVFAINVRAPYFTIQQLLPILGDGASIIFTSSVVARAQGGEHAGEKPGAGSGRARHSRERGGAGRDRDRSVQFRKER